MYCSHPDCQTSAGCKCRNWWPTSPQAPSYTAGATGGRSLSDFTDDEIAREYHARALRKLGDPRIGVGFAGLPEHHLPFAGRKS